MTPAADEFTRATPHYAAAIRTCQRTGEAFTVTRRPSRLLPFAGSLIGALLFYAVAFMALGFIGGLS